MKNILATDVNHYQILGISAEASQAEVKQAYRQLAKQFHPDVQSSASRNPAAAQEKIAHEKIAQVNAAYEVLGDVQLRQEYDRAVRSRRDSDANQRANRTAEAQRHYSSQYSEQAAGSGPRSKRRSQTETTIEQWLRTVYNPTDKLIGQILKPLKAEVKALSADPFDDELMEAFQAYIETCRTALEKAQAKFKSMPNPPGVASGAANIYYCLNQLEDGIEEIERFTYTYDDSYLHTGQELFRISAGLRKEAKAEIKAVL
jgi:molecular chaperone DnaJ